MTIRKRTGILLALWVALFAVAVAVDRPVARWALDAKLIPQRNRPAWANALKAPGDFKYVAVVIAVAALVHPARWRAAVALLVASALSGLLYSSKWAFGRHRPSYLFEPFTFHPFKDGLPGYLYAQRLGFPSGHTCLAFAAAAGLAALFPRYAIAFYGVGVQRVLEGSHYPSDIVAGAGLGVVSAFIALRLCENWFGAGWRTSGKDADGITRIREPFAAS
jgi:membrane-associated phospholipid phosphatase